MTIRGAYNLCKWCHGRGCLQCDIEREKDVLKMPEPIFTARLDNPNDVELMKNFFGRDAIDRAFGPDGGGIREIQRNAAIASLRQFLHNAQQKNETLLDEAKR